MATMLGSQEGKKLGNCQYLDVNITETWVGICLSVDTPLVYIVPVHFPCSSAQIVKRSARVCIVILSV